MIDINELREAIQTFGSQAINEDDLNELLDRLEAAEQTAQDYLRIDGEKARIAQKLEAAEKERDKLKEEVARLLTLAHDQNRELIRLREDHRTLRTKIEQMEKQEPVGTLHDDGCFVWRNGRPYESNYAGWKMALYTLPGTQPAPSIRPAALSPVINWLRNGCDPMKAADELEMLAAAPEAKP